MGEFDEFIRSEPEEVPQAEPRVRATAPRSSNTQLNKSLTELILGESSPHQFAEKVIIKGLKITVGTVIFFTRVRMNT